MYPNRRSESSNAHTALCDSIGRTRRIHSIVPTTPRRSERITPTTPRRSERLTPATPRRSKRIVTSSATPQQISRRVAPATPTRGSGRIRKPTLKMLEATPSPSKRASRNVPNRRKGKAVARARPSTPELTSDSSDGFSTPKKRSTGSPSIEVFETARMPQFSYVDEPCHSETTPVLVKTLFESWEDNPKAQSPKPTDPEAEEATFQEMLENYTTFNGVRWEAF